MKYRQAYLIVLFVLISILHLTIEQLNLPALFYYLTKPALLSILTLFFYLNVKPQLSKFSWLILLGLIFSIGGDSFLMFKGETWFLLGLLSFLMTHIFYTWAFGIFNGQGLVKQNWWLVLPFIAYWAGLLIFLWNDLGEMKIPVIIYGAIINIMAIAALNMFGKVNKATAQLLFFGAILFLFSDSIIALTKFKSNQINIPAKRLMIMIPYLLSQLMILFGSLKAIHQTNRND